MRVAHPGQRRKAGPSKGQRRRSQGGRSGNRNQETPRRTERKSGTTEQAARRLLRQEPRSEDPGKEFYRDRQNPTQEERGGDRNATVTGRQNAAARHASGETWSFQKRKWQLSGLECLCLENQKSERGEI
ncbi:hypothetical protein NDU88_001369 [Pleurodeles waltl]|uniref:Uncharacterized protein n=1 Tax=Pleurodeles waltl TaxID=8319 RepID=A0AAV7Q9L9_PLEWA|nr:hypothetical protein NDU88_001369 [Pleurodeles waltl]